MRSTKFCFSLMLMAASLLTVAFASDDGFLGGLCLDEAQLILSLSSDRRVTRDCGLTKAQHDQVSMVRTQAWERGILEAKQTDTIGRTDSDLFEAVLLVGRERAKVVLGQLTDKQRLRFWQIVRQVRGLDFIYVHYGVMEELGFTDKQRRALEKICKGSFAKMEPLCQQIWRGRAAGLGPDETSAARMALIDDMTERFLSLRRGRDYAIRSLLSPTQTKAVTRLLGEPFSLSQDGLPMLWPSCAIECHPIEPIMHAGLGIWGEKRGFGDVGESREEGHVPTFHNASSSEVVNETK